jgi:hypothetical protein
MKKIFIFLSLFFSSYCLSAHATNIVDPKPNHADQVLILLGNGKFLTLTEYINLSPKEYKRITGQKLSFTKKIKMKAHQIVLKKSIKKDGTIKKGLFSSWSWHWGGFALGFFLSGLGVIIALFFNDEYKWDRFGTALFTAGVVASILLIIVAASGSVY